jgi:TonB family protein
MEAWTFHPAFKDGKRTMALTKREFEFKTRDRDSAIDQETASIASRIREGRFEPASAADLEAPLKPRFTAAPAYPTALLGKGIEGIAKIEVIVDGDGRAVLPRIVEASEPEFGWAAATAAQRWLFEPPKVGGKPVEVRVMIPFRFTPPDEETMNKQRDEHDT